MRCVVYGLIFAVAAGLSESRAQEKAAEDTKPNIEKLRLVAVLQRDNERIQKYYNGCPADVYGSERSAIGKLLFGVETSAKSCGIEPEACYELCIGGDGEVCFSLGQAMEEYVAVVGAGRGQPFFALGCAAGNALSCTNRGAGMRNGGYPDDPAQQWPLSERQKCQFRLFERACANKTGWGCVMLGQAYANGEGVKADAAKARLHYDRTCAESADKNACDFARQLQGILNNRN